MPITDYKEGILSMLSKLASYSKNTQNSKLRVLDVKSPFKPEVLKLKTILRFQILSILWMGQQPGSGPTHAIFVSIAVTAGRVHKGSLPV